MSRIVPLQLLNSGECGAVLEVSGDMHLVRRLDEMGLRTGCQVLMVQAGSPCIVALDQQRLSFRGVDLASVLVEVA